MRRNLQIHRAVFDKVAAPEPRRNAGYAATSLDLAAPERKVLNRSIFELVE